MTLPELVVGLAVLAVLAGLALPEMLSWRLRILLDEQADAIHSSLLLARSEAIRRNGRVVVCKSADGERCAGGSGWEQGHIVFEDRNNNGLRDPGEVLLRAAPPVAPGYSANGNTPVRNAVSYNWAGTTKLPSGAFQAGTITVCRRSLVAAQARLVVVNAAGRPRVSATTVADCA